jgi:chemotaxis protein MotB
MPEGPDGKTIIIVKKISGHGGHHGGAWKVAYADFVTAMMALFMVLWLVNTASVTTREKIASYFRKPGVFEKGSGTPLEIGGGGILSDSFTPPAESNSQVAPSYRVYSVESQTGDYREGFGRGEGIAEGEKAGSEHNGPELELIAQEIREALKAREAGTGEVGKESGKVDSNGETFTQSLGRVEIKIDQRGLHIDIMDTEQASMFSSGSAVVHSEAREDVKKIGALLATLPNPIDIEGHTDAQPFKGAGKNSYDNWNLSVDRANAARRLLAEAGVKSSKIARVVGYADQRPRVIDNPLDPSNRRITISMRFTEEAAEALGEKAVKFDNSKPLTSLLNKSRNEQPVDSNGTATLRETPKFITTDNLGLPNVPAIVPNSKQSFDSNKANSSENVEAIKSYETNEFQEQKDNNARRSNKAKTTTEGKVQNKNNLNIQVGTHLPEGEPATDKAAPEKKPFWLDGPGVFDSNESFFGAF